MVWGTQSSHDFEFVRLGWWSKWFALTIQLIKGERALSFVIPMGSMLCGALHLSRSVEKTHSMTCLTFFAFTGPVRLNARPEAIAPPTGAQPKLTLVQVTSELATNSQAIVTAAMLHRAYSITQHWASH